MKFDVKIYGITDRVDNINENKKILSLSDNDVMVIERNGKFPWPMTKWAFLEPIPEGVTHRLILQDDVELCPGFVDYLNRIIEARPHDILHLVALDWYEQDDRVEHLESPYINLIERVEGCAFVVPVEYLQDMITWIEFMYPKIANGDPHEDTAIWLYAVNHHVQITQTVPSIAQHIGDHSSLFLWDRPARTYYFKDWESANWENPKLNYLKKRKQEKRRF